MVDKEAIEKAVREIIAGLGALSPSNGLLDTPTRVAVAYEELFSGIDQDPSKELAASFEADHDDLVMVRHMPFYSMCEHHLLPFFGSADIGYIPSGKVAGVSKLARVVGDPVSEAADAGAANTAGGGHDIRGGVAGRVGGDVKRRAPVHDHAGDSEARDSHRHPGDKR